MFILISPAISSMCLNNELILRSATENPTAICDVFKQYCVFSLQYFIETFGSKLNVSIVA